MAGFEDEDYLVRQFKQIGDILGSIVSQRSSDEIMHFDVKQSQVNLETNKKAKNPEKDF